MSNPVGCLMPERGIEAFRVYERLDRRHLNAVCLFRVVRAVAAVANGSAGVRKELFGPGDPFDLRQR